MSCSPSAPPGLRGTHPWRDDLGEGSRLWGSSCAIRQPGPEPMFFPTTKECHIVKTSSGSFLIWSYLHLYDVSIYIYTCIHTYVTLRYVTLTDILTYVRTYVRTYIHTYICIYVYLYLYLFIYIYIPAVYPLL